ncbi:aldo/keto reductase [Microbotryum lychnidis-dioicae p1A1 Lamole]|uniref:Aldo/keto reductase n=1 Tax=Microbotryum lychnidis-dioicae (strain p1A1 Lamole / MvSl-1064) TaxID=683840 RepID=U5HAH5_USTV1|nr:aldo/keto reductase [Microbotryum lychnidis-dioicae p1A1 Lamole]|eukprot:KDE05405.1 aldo/keto reductase [Microbotryum lychnidis-dioicae p1A1 Lamole]
MPNDTFTIDGQTWPRPGFGAMGLSAFYGKTNFEEAQHTLRAAIKSGCTVWNTADVYGFGKNEELISSILASDPELRKKVFLVSKWGLRWGSSIPGGFKVDGSPEYFEQAIEASIKRLGFTPDAYLLHRVDSQTDIEESIRAMDKARKAGKFKYLGVSECSAATLRKISKITKIDFIEVEYSLWTLDMERNGVLEACKELGVLVNAYSPLGRGFLTGRYKTASDFKNDEDWRASLPRLQEEVFEQNYKIVEEIEKIAQRKGCTKGQLALAWLLAQGDNIIPIPGTKSEKYLLENFASRKIELTDEEVKELRTIAEKHEPVGTRYQESGMGTLEG